MTAAIVPRSAGSESDAGPMVSRIFVRRSVVCMAPAIVGPPGAIHVCIPVLMRCHPPLK